MKKVLLASTALVATSGFASAQGVELSGFAEMGIFGGDSIETQFHTDIDVKFSLSGETDNGLTFGATVDLDEVSGGLGNTSGPHSVFLSGNFGTLTMGDTDGAFDWALSEVGIGSAITDDHTTHGGFNGNSGLDGTYDGQIARYDYSFGDFAFAVSAELDDTGAGDPVIGVGVRYSGEFGGLSDFALGFGYADNGAVDIYGVSLRLGLSGGFQGVLNYSDHSAFGSHTAVGLGYSMDALTIGFNWGDFDGGTDGYGVAVNYDLGGGAVVQFGYGDDSTGFNQYSLGVALSF